MSYCRLLRRRAVGHCAVAPLLRRVTTGCCVVTPPPEAPLLTGRRWPLRRRAAVGKRAVQRLRILAHPAFTLMLGRESCRYSASPSQPRGDSLGLNPFQHAVFVIAYMNGSIAQKNRPILAIFFGFRRLAKENGRSYSSILEILRNNAGKIAQMSARARTKSSKNAKNCQTRRKIVRKGEFNANTPQGMPRIAP